MGEPSFTGKEWDADLQLYYYNARWYEPSTGRFISVDPVRQGINWYVYCRNNPLAFLDPSGTEYIPGMGWVDEPEDKGMNLAYEIYEGLEEERLSLERTKKKKWLKDIIDSYINDLEREDIDTDTRLNFSNKMYEFMGIYNDAFVDKKYTSADFLPGSYKTGSFGKYYPRVPYANRKGKSNLNIAGVDFSYNFQDCLEYVHSGVDRRINKKGVFLKSVGYMEVLGKRVGKKEGRITLGLIGTDVQITFRHLDAKKVKQIGVGQMFGPGDDIIQYPGKDAGSGHHVHFEEAALLNGVPQFRNIDTHEFGNPNETYWGNFYREPKIMIEHGSSSTSYQLENFDSWGSWAFLEPIYYR